MGKILAPSIYVHAVLSEGYVVEVGIRIDIPAPVTFIRGLTIVAKISRAVLGARENGARDSDLRYEVLDFSLECHSKNWVSLDIPESYIVLLWTTRCVEDLIGGILYLDAPEQMVGA
jgi:hypothetical protein